MSNIKSLLLKALDLIWSYSPISPFYWCSSTGLGLIVQYGDSDSRETIVQKEEVLARLRVRSVPLQGNICSLVQLGDHVLASHNSHVKGLFFDAQVEEVHFGLKGGAFYTESSNEIPSWVTKQYWLKYNYSSEFWEIYQFLSFKLASQFKYMDRIITINYLSIWKCHIFLLYKKHSTFFIKLLVYLYCNDTILWMRAKCCSFISEFWITVLFTISIILLHTCTFGKSRKTEKMDVFYGENLSTISKYQVPLSHLSSPKKPISFAKNQISTRSTNDKVVNF